MPLIPQGEHSLVLSAQALQDDAAISIAKELSSNKALSLLDLRDNLVGEPGAVALEQAVRFENSTLMTLLLEGNPCIEACPSTVANIGRLLKRNATLNSSRTPRTARTSRPPTVAPGTGSMTPMSLASSFSSSSLSSASLMPPPAPHRPCTTTTTHTTTTAVPSPAAAVTSPPPGSISNTQPVHVLPLAAARLANGSMSEHAENAEQESSACTPAAAAAAGLHAGLSTEPQTEQQQRLQRLELAHSYAAQEAREVRELLARLERVVCGGCGAPAAEGGLSGMQEQRLQELEAAVACKAEQDTTELRLQRLEDAAADALGGLLEIRQLAASISHRQMNHIHEVAASMSVAAEERALLRQRLELVEQQQQHSSSLLAFKALEARMSVLERGHVKTPSNGQLSSSNGHGSVGEAAGPPTPCGARPTLNVDASSATASASAPALHPHERSRLSGLSTPPNPCVIDSIDSPCSTQSICSAALQGHADSHISRAGRTHHQGAMPSVNTQRPYSSLVWYKNIAANTSVAGSRGGTDAGSTDADDSPRIQISPVFRHNEQGSTGAGLGLGQQQLQQQQQQQHGEPDVQRADSLSGLSVNLPAVNTSQRVAPAGGGACGSDLSVACGAWGGSEDAETGRADGRYGAGGNGSHSGGDEEGDEDDDEEGYAEYGIGVGGADVDGDRGVCARTQGAGDDQGTEPAVYRSQPSRSSIDVTQLLKCGGAELCPHDDIAQLDQAHSRPDDISSDSQNNGGLASPHLAAAPSLVSLPLSKQRTSPSKQPRVQSSPSKSLAKGPTLNTSARAGMRR